MRICLLSGYRNTLDEGMMNMAVHLSRELAKSHELFHMNARTGIFSRSFWQHIRHLQPQIIHLFLRPGIATLTLAKVLQLYCGGAKTVISAFQPPYHYHFLKGLMPLIKPDMVLVQSADTEQIFAQLGCRIAFFPSGVDINKFAPVSGETKERLREKYSVDKDKFIILHVGHILTGRNIEVLSQIQGQGNNQVIIVGSTSFKPDKIVLRNLREKECIVWQEYLAELDEIYGLSDCYLFPVVSQSNSIEMPLSVMEAMSCNLPVLSTKFGALARVFDEGDGLTFISREDNFVSQLGALRSSDTVVRTREKVLSYTWEKVAANLDRIYESIITE